MRAHLTCTVGGRSAEYVLELKGEGDGYVVAYQYGRIGSTLRSGLKTKLPVAWAVAAKAYNAILSEKVGEGYTGEGQGSFAGDAPESVDENRDDELLPDEDDLEDPDFYEPEPQPFAGGYACELLTDVGEAEAMRYVKSDEWLAQTKEDGDRCGICKQNGSIFGLNRKGKPVGLRPEVAAEYAKLAASTFLLDGEAVNGSVVWDVLQLDGVDLRQRPYVERLAILQRLVGPGSGPVVRVVRTWQGAAEKTQAILDLHAAGAEGVCFKLKSAPWKPGRSHSHLKLKFWKTLTARVGTKTKRAHLDHNSAALELYDEVKKMWVAVGHVSLNGKPAVRVGQLIEVRYLYYWCAALYQATFLRVRDDVDESAASMSQIKHRAKEVA